MKFLKLLGFVSSSFVAPAPALVPAVIPQRVREGDIPGMILDKAASLIEKNGLCKGAYYGTGYTLCSVGAIYRATSIVGKEQGLSPISAILARNLATTRFVDTVGMKHIPTWNDHFWRTEKNVIRTFRKAALKPD